MKVLFLSELNNIHTKKWVKGLANRDCEVSVFGLSKPLDDFYDKLSNVKSYSVDFTGLGDKGILSKIAYLKVIKQLKKICSEFEPDIVHAHYATSYGLLGSFLKKEPFLISVWGFDVYKFPHSSLLHKKILKRNLKKATHLFSTSHVMAAETKKYTNKKVEVIPFGVNLDLFNYIEIEKQNLDFTIGIVKTLEENYGIKFLIEAFKKIKDTNPNLNLKLKIVGKGREENNLKNLAKTLNVISSVEFLGFVENDKLPPLINQMDVVVIPSFVESFGVAAVEALACKVPVIASDVDGLAEVVIDGENGYLSLPGNANSIAEKVQLLINDPTLRKRLGENGRQSVMDKYDWEKNVDTQIEHYKRILS